MKILVGYDGSSASKEALKLARKHAGAFQGKVVVLTSLLGDTETSSEEYRQARDSLSEAEQSFQGSGIEVETHLVVLGRTPGEDIVEHAENNGIDEIVIGIRRRSPLSKLITGSNARYVILRAPCPVLTVKGPKP